MLSQFLRIELDAEIAEKAAQYLAYLITEGSRIEYPDAVIAATFKIIDAGCLLTLNKNHFDLIPDLKGKVYEPREFFKFQNENLQRSI